MYVTLQGIRKRAQSIQKHNDCPHVLSRGGYDLLEKKLLDQKRKRIQEEALLSENPASVDEPSSPIKRHVKWKVARTRAVGNMTSDSAQEIADKIVSSPICCNVHMFKYFVMKMTARCVFFCHLFCVGLLRRAGNAGFVCTPWSARHTEHCHWTT